MRTYYPPIPRRPVKEVLNEKLPCSNCDKRVQCDIERKACVDFMHYSNSGRFGKLHDRVPTRQIYNTIFWENDE